MITQTRLFELKPSVAMKKALDRNCDYRRYCWNLALETWNKLYFSRQVLFTPQLKKKLKKFHEELKKHPHKKPNVFFDEYDYSQLLNNPAPNERRVRDLLVANKEDWQYSYSAHLLQLTVKDLANAWKNYFNKAQPDWGKPRFKSKKNPRQGFKSDQAKIKDGCLLLEKPRKYQGNWEPLPLSEQPLSNKFGVVSVYREKGKYYAAIPFKVEDKQALPKTGKYTGIDVNVNHFDYLDGRQLVVPKKLFKSFDKIKFYQRQLAKKRVVNGQITGTQSKRYEKVRTKLNREYAKAKNIQYDLMHKFTTSLVKEYDQLVIEDLSVKDMLMSHVASKGMHQSMFGLFRQLITYKCQWYGKELILANKLYPSTQRCAKCGNVKKGAEKITLQGNKKHSTRHDQYICYKCGYRNDRDANAVLNLTYLVNHPELNRVL